MSPRPDAASRLRRLLAVIPWIVDHQGIALSDLAARFGIPTPELEADLGLIPFCGLPPYTPDRLIDCDISDGRVHLRFAEYFARPLRLTPAEGFSLLAAGRALLAVPGADAGGSLASALDKLAAALGVPPGMTVELDPARFLGPLRSAAEAREQVEIDYYSFGRDELTTRRIDPRSVFGASGRWYVDTWCHLVGDERLFRVDRVRAVRPTGGHFAARPGGEPLSPPGPVFKPGPGDRRVTLRLSPAARWVAESHPVESDEVGADGWSRVVLAASAPAWLDRLLLVCGPEAEVLDPPEVAAGVASAAARILARYTVPAGGDERDGARAP